MSRIRLAINGKEVEVASGTTILESAWNLGIYIPTLCSHPDLPPARGAAASGEIYQGDRRIENAMPGVPARECGLCVVEVQGTGELIASCCTEVKPGMVVVTENERIRAKRQENLAPILSRHRHACLTCGQQEGCSLSQCSNNVPETERCCTLFGHCELQDVAKYIGISTITPKWAPADLPMLDQGPLYIRDYTLCIGCVRCVRACKDLRGVEAIGFVWDENGRLQVGSLSQTLEEAGCKFCMACVDVCPTGALRDKKARQGKEGDLVPCTATCPAHIDVPGYIRLIAQGKPEQADARIREKAPFPGILGRVCGSPCEKVCRRGEINEAVSICALKRYAADSTIAVRKEHGISVAETGRKAAVVGSGPAGLTVAFYLRKKGHSVTVFEKRGKPGGMMRYGIPRYRLPEDVLEREIQKVFDLGVVFRPHQILGRDFTLKQLASDGYDVIFLGLGAQAGKPLPLQGSDHSDVLWGVDLLSRVGENEEFSLKERVIVVGGGDVAVDAARTALRQGAAQVTLVCLEMREEMPAQASGVDRALGEGVRLLPSWGPKRVVRESGQIKGLELMHCSSVFDDQSVFNPSFDDARQTIEGDQVILATGQDPDISFLAQEEGIQVEHGRIVVEEITHETGMKGVYAGGDMVSASGSLIHAVAEGRRAASAMDRALGGSGNIEEPPIEKKEPGRLLGRHQGFAHWPRERLPEIAPEKSREGYEEVFVRFTDAQALREAARCLQCDLRLHMAANPSPPPKLIAFNGGVMEHVPEQEGVLLLYDGKYKVIAIQGTPNLRRELHLSLEENAKAAWFEFELDKMYSKRESELIQNYLQRHGHMPGSGEEEDLF
jgi:formate dehydrogenase (NADP+) beta subunit